jgi:hypothetical protein
VLSLLRMVCEASARIKGGLLIAGKPYANLDPTDMVLKWAPWFAPTFQDRLAEAQSLREALNAGIVSQQTAIQAAANTYDIEDVPGEQAAILADKLATVDRATSEGATVQIREYASP